MKKIVLTFLTTVYLQCGAQNLVQNPSFEIYNNCPFELSQIEFSNNWSAGCEYGISTDYYNSCMNEDTTISDPFVLKISKEIDPRTGYSFSGILTYYYGSIINYSHNYREVLSNQLIKPLSHNINYCVTFYIKFAGY